MMTSLNDILEMNNFSEIKVEFFKQLPILWSHLGFLFRPLSFLTQIFIPRYFSSKFKWVRFSREVMLIGVGRK